MIAFLGLLAWSGCASLSGGKELFYVCSYDVVWDAALQSVKDRPIQVQDKERARMTVAVKRLNDVTSVSVLENRQRWHLKGGISQESTKWWPIDPSEKAEATVESRLNNKLKEKGCVAS